MMRVAVVSFCLLKWILSTNALELRMASNYLNSMASGGVQMKPSTIKKWSPTDAGGQSKMKASTLKPWTPAHESTSSGNSYVDRLSSPDASFTSQSATITNDDSVSHKFSTPDLAEPKGPTSYLEEISGPASQAFLVSYSPTKMSFSKKSNPLSGNYLERLSEGGVVAESLAPTETVDGENSSLRTPDKPDTKPSVRRKASGYIRRQLQVDNLDMLKPISRF